MDAVATNCTKLNELNLSCLHIHASHKELNRLCSIISKMKNLISLAVPPCNLINNININSEKIRILPSRSWSCSSYKPQFVSNLVLSDESSSSSLDDNVILARKLRSSQEDSSEVSYTESGLDTIVASCCKIEELEIIDTGFHSAFSRLSTNQDQFFW